MMRECKCMLRQRKSSAESYRRERHVFCALRALALAQRGVVDERRAAQKERAGHAGGCGVARGFGVRLRGLHARQAALV